MAKYSFKIIGAILALIFTGLYFFFNLCELDSYYANSDLFLWIATMSVYIIAFSKEKLDDERVAKFRNNAMRIAFGFCLSLLLSISFVVINTKFNVVIKEHFLLIILISLVVYLTVFYVSLFNYIDGDNNFTLSENIKRNKRFYFYYTIVLIIIILVLELII